MNCQTFSPNPRTRGKSHHQHPHGTLVIDQQNLQNLRFFSTEDKCPITFLPAQSLSGYFFIFIFQTLRHRIADPVTEPLKYKQTVDPNLHPTDKHHHRHPTHKHNYSHLFFRQLYTALATERGTGLQCRNS